MELARTTHPVSNTISTYGRARELAARRKLESDAFVTGVYRNVSPSAHDPTDVSAPVSMCVPFKDT